MTEIGREPKKKSKGNRAIRMNLFFLAVFVLFTALIFKLGVVQIVEGEQHEEDAEKSNAKTAYYPAPRGRCTTETRKLLSTTRAFQKLCMYQHLAQKQKIKSKQRSGLLLSFILIPNF